MYNNTWLKDHLGTEKPQMNSSQCMWSKWLQSTTIISVTTKTHSHFSFASFRLHYEILAHVKCGHATHFPRNKIEEKKCIKNRQMDSFDLDCVKIILVDTLTEPLCQLDSNYTKLSHFTKAKNVMVKTTCLASSSEKVPALQRWHIFIQIFPFYYSNIHFFLIIGISCHAPTCTSCR